MMESVRVMTEEQRRSLWALASPAGVDLVDIPPFLADYLEPYLVKVGDVDESVRTLLVMSRVLR